MQRMRLAVSWASTFVTIPFEQSQRIACVFAQFARCGDSCKLPTLGSEPKHNVYHGKCALLLVVIKANAGRHVRI